MPSMMWNTPRGGAAAGWPVLRHWKLLLLAILGAALVQGCGFQLRGKVTLNESLERPFVKSTDRDIEEFLIDSLDFSGYPPVASESGATAVIDLYSSKFDREVRTLDTRGVATGYLLTYRIEYRVVEASGTELIPPTALRLGKNVNYDPEEVLAQEDEEEFLREEMAKELAQRIMRQLQAVQ